MKAACVVAALLLMQPLQAEVIKEGSYSYLEEQPGYLKVLVASEMASPTIPRVAALLRECGANTVHPRTLDVLNLVSANMLPVEAAKWAIDTFDSVQSVWAACVMEGLGGET